MGIPAKLPRKYVTIWQASGERAEDFAALFQLFVGDGIADPEVGVALAEDVAGDDQHILGDGAFDKGAGGLIGGGFGEDVEGSLWFHHVEFAAQGFVGDVALSLV